MGAGALAAGIGAAGGSSLEKVTSIDGVPVAPWGSGQVTVIFQTTGGVMLRLQT